MNHNPARETGSTLDPAIAGPGAGQPVAQSESALSESALSESALSAAAQSVAALSARLGGSVDLESDADLSEPSDPAQFDPPRSEDPTENDRIEQLLRETARQDVLPMLGFLAATRQPEVEAEAEMEAEVQAPAPPKADMMNTPDASEASETTAPQTRAETSPPETSAETTRTALPMTHTTTENRTAARFVPMARDRAEFAASVGVTLPAISPDASATVSPETSPFAPPAGSLIHDDEDSLFNVMLPASALNGPVDWSGDGSSSPLARREQRSSTWVPLAAAPSLFADRKNPSETDSSEVVDRRSNTDRRATPPAAVQAPATQTPAAPARVPTPGPMLDTDTPVEIKPTEIKPTEPKPTEIKPIDAATTAASLATVLAPTQGFDNDAESTEAASAKDSSAHEESVHGSSAHEETSTSTAQSSPFPKRGSDKPSKKDKTPKAKTPRAKAKKAVADAAISDEPSSNVSAQVADEESKRSTASTLRRAATFVALAAGIAGLALIGRSVLNTKTAPATPVVVTQSSLATAPSGTIELSPPSEDLTPTTVPPLTAAPTTAAAPISTSAPVVSTAEVVDGPVVFDEPIAGEIVTEEPATEVTVPEELSFVIEDLVVEDPLVQAPSLIDPSVTAPTTTPATTTPATTTKPVATTKPAAPTTVVNKVAFE